MEHAGFTMDTQIVEEVVGFSFGAVSPLAFELDGFEDPAEEHVSDMEGRKLLRLHVKRERSLKLVKAFKKRLSSFHCSICGFDFEKVYGKIGSNFIEAHHTKPISEMTEAEEVSINDLIAVCSNCHRMLHRSIPALKAGDIRGLMAEALEKRSI
jgi:predicted HNH restriction endonuclease